jgi:redox-sensitive bicupin YhaK (pirin superfamily)
VLGGDVEHGDSMGNNGIITSGDVQWMTAGSGVIHQEMPKGDSSGRMLGFQLWANLPASQKMIDPRYRDVRSNQIPEVSLDSGVNIKIICGRVGDAEGPVRDIVIDPKYLDVTVPPQTTYRHPTKKGHNVFAYVIDGKGYFCKEKKPFSYEVQGASYFDMTREPFLDDGTLVLFGDGEEVFVSTEEDSVRFLLMSGKPIGEPVAWYGPVVMNTQEELRVAFEEYREGTFVKRKG